MTTDAIARLLHEAAKAELVRQGFADHTFKASKDHATFSHCTICDHRRDRALNIRVDRHSPEMDEWDVISDSRRALYRTQADVVAPLVEAARQLFEFVNVLDFTEPFDDDELDTRIGYLGAALAALDGDGA